MAVERRAGEAVLGEAPEELCFTLGDLDRGRKFLATTRRECPSEQAVKVNRVRLLRLVTGDPRDLPRSLRTSVAFEGDGSVP